MMKIILNPDKTLQAIQDEFTAFFPYLKIEFFRTEYKASSGYQDKEKLDLNLSLAEVNLLIETGTLEFDNTTKVVTFEKAFYDLSNIAIQVFRKTNSAWIQTIASDNWTLADQQKEAEALLTDADKEEPIDYHEQE